MYIADILIHEPAEIYHAQDSVYLTSHRLDEFRRNAPLFRRRELGLVRDEDRPTYLIGRAAHTLILEGREIYNKMYVFGGPVNPKTGLVYGIRSQAYTTWASAQTTPVLDDEQAALIEKLNTAVYAHDRAAALLADGIAEGVVRTDYCGVQCQARLDWVNPDYGIIDFKTTDNLDWLMVDAHKYSYVHQMAFYRALVAKLSGIISPAYLIAAEKREPYRVGVWRIGEAVLGLAQAENEQAIARLVRSRETDTWPSGYEEIRDLDVS